MKKFVLTGTDNDGLRHRYSAEKSMGFRKVFIKFMNKLGFDEKEVKGKFHQTFREGDDNAEIYAEWTLDADELTDKVWYFKNKKYEVDVFFGARKVSIIVRTKDRKHMLDILKEDVSWKSDEEFEKIRSEDHEELKQRALAEIEKRKKKTAKQEVKAK